MNNKQENKIMLEDIDWWNILSTKPITTNIYKNETYDNIMSYDIYPLLPIIPYSPIIIKPKIF